jgi:hypothetical protein
MLIVICVCVFMCACMDGLRFSCSSCSVCMHAWVKSFVFFPTAKHVLDFDLYGLFLDVDPDAHRNLSLGMCLMLCLCVSSFVFISSLCTIVSW